MRAAYSRMPAPREVFYAAIDQRTAWNEPVYVTSEIVSTLNLTTDVRNTIRNLEIWPFSPPS